MKYYVEIAGRTFEVDLTGETPHVDGQPLAADLAAVPGSSLHSLLLDGRSVLLHARPGEARGSWELQLAGRRFALEVVDERTRTIRGLTVGSAAPKGPKPVRAPMPGLVVRLQVEAGQEVRAGQGVAIIEAMKMENELRAETAGVVSRVLVEPGQAVEKGTVLVEFEPAAASQSA